MQTGLQRSLYKHCHHAGYSWRVLTERKCPALVTVHACFPEPTPSLQDIPHPNILQASQLAPTIFILESSRTPQYNGTQNCTVHWGLSLNKLFPRCPLRPPDHQTPDSSVDVLHRQLQNHVWVVNCTRPPLKGVKVLCSGDFNERSQGKAPG